MAVTPPRPAHRRYPATPQGPHFADLIELRDLRCFAAAARAGNLAQAARDMNITASAVSQQLRKLECGLATTLLIRHSRGVTTTQAGCRLLERFDAVMRLLAAPLGPGESHTAPGGSVSLAIPAELATVLASPILSAIRQQRPELVVMLRESADSSAESEVLTGQADLAVVPEPPRLDELQLEPLLKERLGLAVGPSSPLAAAMRPIGLRTLDTVPLILPGKRHWIRRLLARAAFQHGMRCVPAFEVDGLAITKDMVRLGLGCAVLPRAALRDEISRGALVFVPLEQPALTATYAIAHDPQAPPAVREMARMVTDTLHGTVANDAWPGARPCRPATAAAPAPTPDMAAVDLAVPPLTARRRISLVEGAFAAGD